MHHVPSYVYMKHIFLDHRMSLGCISVPLLSRYFNRVCHSVFQHVFCTSVIAVKVIYIWFIGLGWKYYEVPLCKNLLLRFLFTCDITFHLCGGAGLVCMNCVTDRPLLLPTIICRIETSKTELALIEIRIIQLLTVFLFVLLTLHLSIIVVINQHDALILVL